MVFYNKTIHDLLDKHVPLKSRTATLRPQAEWFTPELQREKSKKRKLERRYRLTHKSEDVHRFNEQCEYYGQLLATTRQSFYTNKIHSNAGDQKAVFALLNKPLHRKAETQLPVHDNLNELTNRFAIFFY